MAFSITSYTFSKDLTEVNLNKLNEFYENNPKPKEITKIVKEIELLGNNYKVFEVAKLFSEQFTFYEIEDNRIIAKEKEVDIWKKSLVYINANLKTIYLIGQNSWPINLISGILFDDTNEIQPKQIDIKNIENDIRNKNKFTFNGTSFEDREGTKVSVSNPSGIKIESNRYLKGNESTEKKNLKILIEKDDKNFNVTLYPSGKITFGGRVADYQTALIIFIKVYDEIKNYIL